MLVYHYFFCYPDPDQRFLKWIRIWIRPNDTDPTGSGSETLGVTTKAANFCLNPKFLLNVRDALRIPKQFLELPNSIRKWVVHHNMCYLSIYL